MLALPLPKVSPTTAPRTAAPSLSAVSQVHAILGVPPPAPKPAAVVPTPSRPPSVPLRPISMAPPTPPALAQVHAILGGAPASSQQAAPPPMPHIVSFPPMIPPAAASAATSVVNAATSAINAVGGPVGLPPIPKIQPITLTGAGAGQVPTSSAPAPSSDGSGILGTLQNLPGIGGMFGGGGAPAPDPTGAEAALSGTDTTGAETALSNGMGAGEATSIEDDSGGTSGPGGASSGALGSPTNTAPGLTIAGVPAKKVAIGAAVAGGALLLWKMVRS